jgi:predicted N-acyltransferase
MKLSAKVFDTIEKLPAAAWDACAGEHPFVRHAFFLALERSGACTPERGVRPRYVTLWDERGELVAGAPAMLKVGNKREFGPEIRWLRRGAAQGCFEWPKFQLGVPFYTVAGPRLLVLPGPHAAALQVALLQVLAQLAEHRYRSGVFNLMHLERSQAEALRERGWVISEETRTLWRNAGHADWAAYLGSLPHRKRRQLLQERERARARGLRFEVLHGEQLTPALVAEFYAAYCRVCVQHGNGPWLPPLFLTQLVATMPQAIRLFAAFDGETLAGAVFAFVDSQRLYVQHWGALEARSAATFELLCYAPIEYAIAQGLRQVDSGLAGAHKRRGGMTDDPVFHAHWFFDERLKALACQELAAVQQPAPLQPGDTSLNG